MGKTSLGKLMSTSASSGFQAETCSHSHLPVHLRTLADLVDDVHVGPFHCPLLLICLPPPLAASSQVQSQLPLHLMLRQTQGPSKIINPGIRLSSHKPSARPLTRFCRAATRPLERRPPGTAARAECWEALSVSAPSCLLDKGIALGLNRHAMDIAACSQTMRLDQAKSCSPFFFFPDAAVLFAALPSAAGPLPGAASVA